MKPLPAAHAAPGPRAWMQTNATETPDKPPDQ